MSERSYSHKSDGRQSSTGHSVHSMTSGRANSLTGLGPSALMEPPGLAPGLFILGSVPAIIRCWLDINFKHDTLLYAAVCSGSFTSYVDLHLLELLGLQEQMTKTDDGVRKIKMSVYLPEAVPINGSSRSNSPAPQLPSVAVEFTVMEDYDAISNQKAIQIFIGSDVLRSHNADLLFSTNQLTLYDDDRCKLQIPLVRPEDDRTFKSLSVSSKPRLPHESLNEPGPRNDVWSRHASHHDSSASITTRDALRVTSKANGSGTASSDDGGSTGRRSFELRPRLGLSTSTRSNGKDTQDSSPPSSTARSGPTPAMLSNWRRDTTEKATTGSLDWANVGKTTSSTTNPKPRDTGMKVLRPARSATRTLSTSTSSPATGQSRFFDDGKRREDDSSAAPSLKRSVSGEKSTENIPAAKPRPANPVGGASAFAWLNSGGSK
jgi:ubiquitin carboxyl-terminal hydrolase 4/11/15